MFAWSEDRKSGLEQEIVELDRLLKEKRKASALAKTLEAKLEIQKTIRQLENQRSAKRRNLYEAQDLIDAERETLIEGLQKRMAPSLSTTPLFTIRWSLV